LAFLAFLASALHLCGPRRRALPLKLGRGELAADRQPGPPASSQ